MPSLTRSGRPSFSFASSPPAGRTSTALRVERLDHGPPIVPERAARLHLVRRRAAAERERELDLVAQQLEHAPRACLPVAGEAPERRAAGEDRAGAERERLDDVGAAADAAVDVDLDPAGDRLDDLRQQRRPSARPRRAGGRRGSRRRSRRRRARTRAAASSAGLDPLEDERQRRQRAQLLEVVPGRATGRSRRAARAASRPPSRRAAAMLGTTISSGTRKPVRRSRSRRPSRGASTVSTIAP